MGNKQSDNKKLLIAGTAFGLTAVLSYLIYK
jgi:hypothetical protein